MSIAEDKLSKKRTFYDTFELLDRSDNELDAGLEASKQAFGVSRDSVTSHHETEANLNTSIKDQITKAVHAKTLDAKKNDDQRISQPRRHTQLLSQAVASLPPPSAIPRANDRRQQKAKIKVVPESQRLFKNMYFYFLPNDDKSQPRRLRILKALEYGASWQQEVNKWVTHIIVDVGIKYEDLPDILKPPKLSTKIEVVNQNWPSDCLMYRILRNPESYRIAGAPSSLIEAEVDKVQDVDAPASDTSLQLKPAGKAVKARRDITPVTNPPAHAQSVVSLEVPMTTVLIDTTSGESVYPEEFRTVINEARVIRELPLDDDDIEIDGNIPGMHKRKSSEWTDKFQCMQSHTKDDAEGPNAEVINILQQMADHYGQVADEWRTRAYRKAIATLRKHPKKISTREEALALSNIGERLATKIEEIVVTHRLRRLDNAQAEPADRTLQHFLKIYGVGYVHASNWVRSGLKTLEDVLARGKPTANQRIGIEHFEDFNLRIPRAEVKQHGQVVEEHLKKLDPAFKLIIGGSYRRGAAESSDIDCVISHDSMEVDMMRTTILDNLITPLTKQGFFKAELSGMNRTDGSKWHGASCLPNSTVWRRIDLLLVPATEYGAAMIYFTGNDIFNRSMRLLASKKGYRLNQHGLYKDVIRGKHQEKITDGTLVEGADERKIFDILRVPWREPHERVI